MKIGEVIETVPCIDEFVKNREVDLLFTSNLSLRSVVVVRDERPIGHITRTHFYQKKLVHVMAIIYLWDVKTNLLLRTIL